MLNKRTWKKQSRRRTKRAAIRALVGLYSQTMSEDLAGGRRQSEGFPGRDHTGCVRLVLTIGLGENHRGFSKSGKLLSEKRTWRKTRHELDVRWANDQKAKRSNAENEPIRRYVLSEDGKLVLESSDKKRKSRAVRRERRRVSGLDFGWSKEEKGGPVEIVERESATTRRARAREALQVRQAAFAERRVDRGNFVYAEGLMGMFRLVRCMNCCDESSRHRGILRECNIDSIIRWRSVIQAIQPHERRRWILTTWNLGKDIPEGVEKKGEMWRGQNTGVDLTTQRPSRGSANPRFGRQAIPGRGSGVKRYPGQKFVPK